MTLPSNDYRQHQTHLLSIFHQAVKAADPADCLRKHLTLDGGQLVVGGRRLKLSQTSRLILLAFGKASLGMARQAIHILGDRLTQGLVVSLTGAQADLPSTVRLFHGGHPLPTAESLTAGEEAQQVLSGLSPSDIVLVLISGGGSAMLELPKTGVDLACLQSITQALLKSGAAIEDINLVRKGLSQSKAGGLVRWAAPAQVAALILSDVVGNRLEAIASGTTVNEHIDPQDVESHLKTYQIWDGIPQAAQQAIVTPSHQPVSGPEPINIIIGSNQLLLDAAAKQAQALGFQAQIVSNRLAGEARLAGEEAARQVANSPTGSCMLWGGETTVTVRGEGLGGRNQELALASAISMDGILQTSLLSAASDGIDGPTDAAGAWVDGSTVQSARQKGFDPLEALEQNNSYPLLNQVDRLVRTGPTGTNVNDLVVALKYGA